MSVLKDFLKEKCLEQEAKGIADSAWRLRCHLMAPVGWLNDPNGLCQYRGVYHVFFQYGPFDVNGGLKLWGHYASRDLVHWEYEGAALYPDSPYDCHGVYSGSAYTDEDGIHLFYTGNIKFDGDYDYINSGRGSNTMYVHSADGTAFGPKEFLMGSADYPADYTCHIRDPKVFCRGGVYYMVLGGRKKGDHGAVLLYCSEDMKQWKLAGELTTRQPFGYMWECPDYFTLGGHSFLAVCPQGVEAEKYRYQNIYQSGYFRIKSGFPGEIEEESFEEWDYGFDFYAPQSFEDESGRRILIGWMGVPDAPYTNPTTAHGWQHALTVPRELQYRDGKILQYPVKELEMLRKAPQKFSESRSGGGCFDLEITEIGPGSWHLDFPGRFSVEYSGGIVTLLMDEQAGFGRTVRRARTGEIHTLRLLMDTSAAELYLNGGEYVFSTRVYPQNPELCTAAWTGAKMQAEIYELHA